MLCPVWRNIAFVPWCKFGFQGAKTNLHRTDSTKRCCSIFFKSYVSNLKHYLNFGKAALSANPTDESYTIYLMGENVKTWEWKR